MFPARVVGAGEKVFNLVSIGAETNFFDDVTFRFQQGIPFGCPGYLNGTLEMQMRQEQAQAQLLLNVTGSG